MPTIWDEASDRELRRLWAEGRSTRDIGIKIGATKNQVIGRARRLGIGGHGGTHARPNPVAGQDKKARAKRKADRSAYAARRRREERHRLIRDAIAADCDMGRRLRTNVELAAACDLTDKQVRSALQRMQAAGEVQIRTSYCDRKTRWAVLPDGRRTADPTTTPHKPAKAPPRERVNPANAWTKQSNDNLKRFGVSHRPQRKIREHEMPRVRFDRCQWIEGEPTPREDCKCGRPTFAGAYCREHARRAWSKRLEAEEMV